MQCLYVQGETVSEFLSSCAPFPGMTVDSVFDACLHVDIPHLDDSDFPPNPVLSPALPLQQVTPCSVVTPLPPNMTLELRSRKMRALRRFFCSEKLNASAIRLQLTAQSQVQVKHSGLAAKRQKRDVVG